MRHKLALLSVLAVADAGYADKMPGDPAGGPTPDAAIDVFVGENAHATLNGTRTFRVVGLDEDGQAQAFFSLRGIFVRGGDVVLNERNGDSSDILRFHNPGFRLSDGMIVPGRLVNGYADWFTLYS